MRNITDTFYMPNLTLEELQRLARLSLWMLDPRRSPALGRWLHGVISDELNRRAESEREEVSPMEFDPAAVLIDFHPRDVGAALQMVNIARTQKWSDSIDRFLAWAMDELVSAAKVALELSWSELLSIDEVATLFKVHPNTVRNWSNDGRFPKPIRMTDRCLRWKAADLQQHLDNKLATTAKGE